MIRRSLAILACIGAAHIAAGATAPEVAVTGGTIRGQEMPDGTNLYLGIPYAAPPVGDLRWRPAQPVVPWQGMRDATHPPAPCLQHDEGWNKTDADISREDCLYLSIRSPRRSPRERFPILFWIHGGSNRAGSGFGYARDTTIEQRGVILVSVEYRLGVFGFLGSPELEAESSRHSSGNYALTDQLAALRASPALAILSTSDFLEPPPATDPSLTWMSQILDGWVETLPMRDIYAQHRQAHVPMIIGNNTREINPGMSPDEVRARVRNALGSQADDLLQLYGDSNPAHGDPVLGDVGTQFMTDMVFRCPASQVTNQMLSAGAKVWRYEFGFPRTGTTGPVEHSSELNYVFTAAPADATFKTWPPVQQSWANIARTGTPNGAGLPTWPDMGQSPSYMAFLPSGPQVQKSSRDAACRLLARLQCAARLRRCCIA